MTNGEFGCPGCCGLPPEAAWEARRRFVEVAELVDESHYHVRVLACACGQHFLSVFTETVDWVDGEDPQRSVLLPLTDPERARLLAPGASFATTQLDRDAGTRRFLVMDHPKHGDRTLRWQDGGFAVGPHD